MKEGRRDGGKVRAGHIHRTAVGPDSRQLHRVIARLLQMHLLQGLEAGGLIYWQIHTHYKTQPSLD